MKIIVAGAGKVGATVAGMLAVEGHDVTVIDRDSENLTQLSNELDVICVEGSASSSETLRDAGADKADLILAATKDDEVNMICGISARKLGTRHVIARIRDPEYLAQTEFLREALGLDVIDGESILKNDPRPGKCPLPLLENLLARDNVIYTRHTAFFTDAADRDIVRTTIDGLYQMKNGLPVPSEL